MEIRRQSRFNPFTDERSRDFFDLRIDRRTHAQFRIRRRFDHIEASFDLQELAFDDFRLGRRGLSDSYIALNRGIRDRRLCGRCRHKNAGAADMPRMQVAIVPVDRHCRVQLVKRYAKGDLLSRFDDLPDFEGIRGKPMLYIRFVEQFQHKAIGSAV